MSAQRAVIWTDFAGVLTEPNSVTVQRLCSRKGIVPDDLHAAMTAVGARYGMGAMEVLDTDTIDHATWAASMSEVVGERVGRGVDFEDFPEAWFDGRELNRPWLSHLARLRDAGHFVGLMSNMVRAWDPYRQALIPDYHFDGVLLSFETGCRKPEAEVFELGARSPGGVHLLVDDLPANCAGAVQHGWGAVVFGTADQAAADVAEVVRA